MKNLKHFNICIFLPFLVFFSTQINAQPNAEDILKKSIEAVSKIENGSYKIDFRMKYLDKKDTFNLSGICYFEKDKKIKYGAKLNILQKRGISHIYNGNEIYILKNEDSSALIIDTKKFGYSYLDGNVINELIYEPIIKETINQLINNKDIQIINLESDTIINKKPCYKIKIRFKDDGEVKNIVTTYFIDQESFFPVRKTSNLDWQTQHQYKEHNLYDITVNSLPSSTEKLFGYQSIPDYFTVKNYSEPKQKTKDEMSLQPGNLAPDLQLISLNREAVKLSNLQGKLVFLDFSYQSCFGCKKALLELEKLHQKYKEKGLVILGINPVDTSVTDYKEYLDQRKVSFQFCITSNEIAKQYKVQVYPTFYLIDTTGKIIQADIGYSEKQFGKLEKNIQKQLKLINKNKF